MALTILQDQDMGKIQNVISQSAPRKKRALTTAGKGGYIAAVHNIYVVPPPPPEYDHKPIESINKIVQGMKNQIYDMEGLAQANVILTSSNLAAMVQ